jgi:YD repeat-containing protein
LDRVLTKQFLFSNELCAVEIFKYDGFHLLAKSDKEGNITEYTYDAAGRKISEQFCDHSVTFE